MTFFLFLPLLCNSELKNLICHYIAQVCIMEGCGYSKFYLLQDQCNVMMKFNIKSLSILCSKLPWNLWRHHFSSLSGVQVGSPCMLIVKMSPMYFPYVCIRQLLFRLLTYYLQSGPWMKKYQVFFFSLLGGSEKNNYVQMTLLY